MNIEDNFARQQAIFNTQFNSNTSNNVSSDSGTGFGEILKGYIDDTNSSLVESDNATNAFIKGDDVSIDEVMIKNQEASLSLQFLTQTRDKLLEGYNTLSNLQL